MLSTARIRGKMIHTTERKDYGSLLAEVQPTVIITEAENDRALQIAQHLMFKQDRTPEENKLLDLLVLLIERFEEEYYQPPVASPHDVLLHLMEAKGIRQADLIGVIGSSGVVSEVVNGKRSLSKAQAKALGGFFSVSPALFV